MLLCTSLLFRCEFQELCGIHLFVCQIIPVIKQRIGCDRSRCVLCFLPGGKCNCLEWDVLFLCGLLHDVDFEKYPEEHCIKAPELLAEIGAEEAMVHAICSHAYGSCSDVEPIHLMEKIMFAVDELTGLIGAAARMRPSKSVMDMELSSLKKKFKDKKFAAGCSRDVIKEGADRLGWTLDETMEKTIQAMRSCEASVAAELEKLCG